MNRYLDIFAEVLRIVTFQPRYHERRHPIAHLDEDYIARPRNSSPRRIAANERPR